MESGEPNHGKVEITEIICGAEIGDLATCIGYAEDGGAAVNYKANCACSKGSGAAIYVCENIGGAAA